MDIEFYLVDVVSTISHEEWRSFQEIPSQTQLEDRKRMIVLVPIYILAHVSILDWVEQRGNRTPENGTYSY